MEANKMNKIEKQKVAPEAKFRAGAVSATVWKNEQQVRNAQNFSYFSVNLDRSYKDKQGAWQKTTSLRLNDLPKAALVLNKAYEFLAMNAEEPVNII